LIGWTIFRIGPSGLSLEISLRQFPALSRLIRMISPSPTDTAEGVEIATKPRHSEDRALKWIGGVKLFQALVLLIVATGILSNIHNDLQASVVRWAHRLHFDQDNHFFSLLLEKLGLVTQQQLKQLTWLTFIYAIVFLAEGIGLMMKKRWAEYLTIVVTGSLIPLEISETVRHFGPIKAVLLVFNVGIVWYLIRLLRKQKKEE